MAFVFVLFFPWLSAHAQAPDAPPTRDEAKAAFAEVNTWVRAGGVGASELEFSAAAVTLRLAGELVGHGQAIGRGSPAAATRAAIDRARTKLGAIAEGERWGATASQLTISVEVAGAFVPLARRELDAQIARLNPGVSGVAVRIGDDIDAVFPGTAAVRGLPPNGAITSLFSQLTDDPTSSIRAIGDNVAETNATLYRFRVRHMIQIAPGGASFEATRGGRAVGLDEITTASIREMADGIAAHLVRRRTADGDLPGTYLPTQGRSLAESGTDLDRCLVAYALFRYTRAPGVDTDTALDAWLRAIELLDKVSWNLDKPGAGDPIVAAFALAAVAEGKDSLDGVMAIGRLGPLVELATAQLDGDAPGWVAALGLASLAALTGEAEDLAAAEEAVRSAYAETEPEKLVSTMPWLLIAERRVGGLSGEGVRAVAALRSMRSLIWEHQLVEDAGTPMDMTGGIVFTTRADVRPDWSSLRAISAAAVMLGDERLTDADETLPEVARLVRSLRFVRQLCADEVAGHMYTDPGHAEWGVRGSVWTQRMRADASALGLISACESLDSMSAAQARLTARER